MNTAELLQVVTSQQQQITQILAALQAQNIQAPVQQTQQTQVVIPALPDVSVFEPCDEKSRISEWLQRFRFGIDCAAPNAEDKIKVKALMNKLSENAFSEYAKSCLPRTVTDFGFDETTKKLEKIFAKPQSLFVDRYDCLTAKRAEGEDFRQFVNRLKRLLTDFQFQKLKEEQFRCLILLTALKASTIKAKNFVQINC